MSDSEKIGTSLEQATQTNQQLRALLRVQQAETQSLRAQIQSHTQHQNDLAKLFLYERQRHKNLPRSWTLSVLIHFIFMLQFWSRFKLIPFVLNLFVFFMQWRRLYVPSFQSSGTVSLLIIAITIYFYYRHQQHHSRI